MNSYIQGIRIAAITAALPETNFPLKNLGAQFGEHEIARITRTTGIESVRLAGSLRTSDLCDAAARHLFAQANVDPESIDAIVVVTLTPDFLMPPTSVLLQDRLGLSTRCVALDINHGCSGYIYGLYQAAALIRGASCKRVLLCTGDVTSKLLHEGDRHVRLIFGDAATATLVEAGDDNMHVIVKTNGAGAHHLNTPITYDSTPRGSGTIGHLHMDGVEILGFAISEVPPLIAELLQFSKLSLSDVKLFAFHQANEFMLNYLRKAIGIDKRLFPIGVKEVGNTGSSSIPLLLSLRSADTNLRQSNAILCGFGVGLSWGAATADLTNTLITTPIDVAAIA